MFSHQIIKCIVLVLLLSEVSVNLNILTPGIVVEISQNNCNIKKALTNGNVVNFILSDCYELG